MKIRLLISYDGTSFCGWQTQPQGKGRPSIQKTLESALSRIYKTEINCVSSGRTDAGVHALAQNIHFRLPESGHPNIPLILALRTLLPDTISVRKAWLVPDTFHSGRSALSKTYRYFISTHETQSPFWAHKSYWQKGPLDLQSLNSMSECLIGKKDFKSVQSSSSRAPTSVRTVFRCEWKQTRPNLYFFEIEGNGFLKYMVRNIVGTQLYFLKKNIPLSQFQTLLQALDRKQAGPPAPPQGLFLMKVRYPKHYSLNVIS